MAANTEGVIGMGSWNAKTSPAAKAYFDAHVEEVRARSRTAGRARTPGPACRSCSRRWPRSGLDRKALREQIAKNEFNTILGPIRFKDGENASTPGTVSQWQSGEFEVVWPPDRATAPLIAPKPAWK